MRDICLHVDENSTCLISLTYFMNSVNSAVWQDFACNIIYSSPHSIGFTSSISRVQGENDMSMTATFAGGQPAVYLAKSLHSMTVTAEVTEYRILSTGHLADESGIDPTSSEVPPTK